MASSRVGEIIRAPRPSTSLHFLRYKFSRTGTRNARVFPLPVFAAPRQSLPLRASGIAFFWISVRVLKCEASRPEAVGLERGISEKALKMAALGS